MSNGKELVTGHRLIGIYQCNVLLRQWMQYIGRKVCIDTETFHVVLKIFQFGIHILISTFFRRIHILQLTQNNMKRIFQRKNAHFFLRCITFNFSYTKICINQYQRFQWKIFQFQIPSGVIHRNVSNRRHILFFKPLTCIIIMQMCHAFRFRRFTSEFTDIMAYRRTAHQPNADRYTGIFQLTGHMHCHIVHTGNMA